MCVLTDVLPVENTSLAKKLLSPAWVSGHLYLTIFCLMYLSMTVHHSKRASAFSSYLLSLYTHMTRQLNLCRATKGSTKNALGMRLCRSVQTYDNIFAWLLMESCCLVN